MTETGSQILGISIVLLATWVGQGFCRASRTRFGGGGSKGGSPTETIIAIVIGGVTLVLIVGIIIVFCCCCPRRSCLKCKKTKTRKDENDFVDHTTLTPGSRTQPKTELCDYPQPQSIYQDNPLAYSKIQDYPSTYEPPRKKTNNVVSKQVRHKTVCTSTEDGWRLQILDLKSSQE